MSQRNRNSLVSFNTSLKPAPNQACNATRRNLFAHVVTTSAFPQMEKNMLPDQYIALLARTPKSKRPPIYAAFRREAFYFFFPRLPKKSALYFSKAVMREVADQVARMDEAEARPAASNIVRFPIERRLGSAA